MYIPAHFSPDEALVDELLRNHGAADLVTVTPEGLVATLLPFVWAPSATTRGAAMSPPMWFHLRDAHVVDAVCPQTVRRRIDPLHPITEIEPTLVHTQRLPSFASVMQPTISLGMPSRVVYQRRDPRDKRPSPLPMEAAQRTWLESSSSDRIRMGSKSPGCHLNIFQHNTLRVSVLEKQLHYLLSVRCASSSNTLISGKPCRLPTSKSLKSCPAYS